MVGTMLFETFIQFLDEAVELKKDTGDAILIVQVVKGTPVIEFYKKIGFTEPPTCFNYWKVDGFELMGCSAKQFYDSNGYLKLAVSTFLLYLNIGKESE